MAKLLTDNKISFEIERIIIEATEQIVLIAPCMKLHHRYIAALRNQKVNPKLEVIVVFGKNENKFSQGTSQEDIDFFKDFPNVQIRHEKRLNTKYYANENTGVLTSMDLLGSSQDHNIESGVMVTTKNLIGNIASGIKENFDLQTNEYFQQVIKQSELLFHKIPQFSGGVFGTGLSKKYLNSKVEVDILAGFFSATENANLPMEEKPTPVETKAPQPEEKKPLHEEITPLPEEKINFQEEPRPVRHGYCIRTGIEIPFNPQMPFSGESYRNWATSGNEYHPENYCHYSGERSYGETCHANPIMRKNWDKARTDFGF